MSTDDIAANLEEILTSLRELESLEQERRPVAAVQTPRGTEYTYSDGTRMLWQVDSDGARAPEWAELLPLPGTRRAAEREDGSVPLEWQDNLRRAMLTDREADAEPAELVGELVGLIEEARDKICADWEAYDLLRHALDRAREWQKGGSDG